MVILQLTTNEATALASALNEVTQGELALLSAHEVSALEKLETALADLEVVDGD